MFILNPLVQAFLKRRTLQKMARKRRVWTCSRNRRPGPWSNMDSFG